MSRVFKRKNAWWIDYKSPLGKRVRRKVGKSKKMAQMVLNEMELKIAQHKFLGIVEPKKVFFDNLAKQYLEYSQTNKSERTFINDKSIVKKLLKQFRSKIVGDITLLDVERYKSRRIKEVSGSRVNREIACLKHMFNMAINWNYLRENQIGSVKLFKEPPARLRYLNDDEIDTLLSCCAEHLRPIVIMALNTGMRKSEILNLKWQDIDLKNCLIIIKKTKNNEIRIIPTNDTLYRELRSINREPGNRYVFTNKNGKPYTDVKRSFRTALEHADIKDFRFHDLRHTFASRLVMAGENLRTIQELLGHKDIKMTMRYSHLSMAHKKNAVKKLDIGTHLAPTGDVQLTNPAK